MYCCYFLGDWYSLSRGVRIAAVMNEEKCVCFPGDYLGTFLVLLKLVTIINRRGLQAKLLQYRHFKNTRLSYSHSYTVKTGIWMSMQKANFNFPMTSFNNATIETRHIFPCLIIYIFLYFNWILPCSIYIIFCKFDLKY